MQTSGRQSVSIPSPEELFLESPNRLLFLMMLDLPLGCQNQELLHDLREDLLWTVGGSVSLVISRTTNEPPLINLKGTLGQMHRRGLKPIIRPHISALSMNECDSKSTIVE